jgi:hypothetical protein
MVRLTYEKGDYRTLVIDPRSVSSGRTSTVGQQYSWE